MSIYNTSNPRTCDIIANQIYTNKEDDHKIRIIEVWRQQDANGFVEIRVKFAKLDNSGVWILRLDEFDRHYNLIRR
ncbi:MAG: hypothetical protein GY941_20955 [Planctomycetes bacterium]|nr:hypothetical protein [Planctomycetota bacterium]